MKNLTIGGRLTRDSEVKDVGGQTLLRFAVAVDDRQKVNGQWEKQSLYFDCNWWGQRALKAESFLLKGKSVCVSGDFSVRHYTKGDGTPGHSLSLRVENVTFMGGREEGGGQAGGRYAGQGGQGQSSQASFGGQSNLTDDDIPF